MARQAGSQGAETAERARRAALSLFARHGYAAVSMREIAAETGVGAAALYNHFATKQDLLTELMVKHLETLLAAWDAEPEAAPETEPRAALAAFARFHLRFHAARRDAVFVSTMELRSLDQPNFHRVERLRRAWEDRMEDIVRRGAEAGLFHAPEPRIATMALIGMLTGVTNWYRPAGRLPASAIEALHVEMTLSALGAPMTGDDACSPHP
ncbi:MAG: TetR/AcrR family transcriptional regulator [Pikeienuella sp.]|uniref:TetR/AcrR family transcriptional regulator n=1 Tax=Pikeienuella sp. TaxID=2831957 RepID=UPI0039199051